MYSISKKYLQFEECGRICELNMIDVEHHQGKPPHQVYPHCCLYLNPVVSTAFTQFNFFTLETDIELMTHFSTPVTLYINHRWIINIVFVTLIICSHIK